MSTSPHQALTHVLLRAVASGCTDEPDVDLRIAAARAQYGRLVAFQQVLIEAEQAADRAYLMSLIDGSADYFAEDVYDRLEAIFNRNEGDDRVMSIFTQAADAYGDAVEAEARRVLAQMEADELISRLTGRPSRWEKEDDEGDGA